MIDFRYHIVSLISVFLALAVGIILGAGPLQGAIGDQLTGQVEQLRLERNELRDQLDATNLKVADDQEFIVASGPQLVADSLQDRRVAVVDLGAVDSERYEAVQEQLESAGASVVGHVRLAAAWTDKEQEAERKAVATEIANLVTGSRSPRRTRSWPRDSRRPSPGSSWPRPRPAPRGRADRAQAERGGAHRGRAGAEGPGGPRPADLSAGARRGSGGRDRGRRGRGGQHLRGRDRGPARTGCAGPFRGSLVAGSTPVVGDLVSTIMADSDLAAVLSTVSGIEAPAGQISVPLALAARAGDKVGQFGFEEGATAVIPPPSSFRRSTAPSRDPGHGGRRHRGCRVGRRSDGGLRPVGIFLRALGAGIVSAAVTAGTRSALDAAPLGGPDRWTRTNHRGEPISLLEGPSVAAGLVAGALVAARTRARGRPPPWRQPVAGVRTGRRPGRGRLDTHQGHQGPRGRPAAWTGHHGRAQGPRDRYDVAHGRLRGDPPDRVGSRVPDGRRRQRLDRRAQREPLQPARPTAWTRAQGGSVSPCRWR
ncbi:copper transporter [Oerskovia sp. M15]